MNTHLLLLTKKNFVWFVWFGLVCLVWFEECTGVPDSSAFSAFSQKLSSVRKFGSLFWGNDEWQIFGGPPFGFATAIPVNN